MPCVLQIVHGYPPREHAGTEMATFRLVGALSRLGWRCHVVSATRAPGRAQYARIEEPGVTRVVNNLPWRPLADAEEDRAVAALLATVEARIQPDLVHVQHLAFLTSSPRFRAPVIGTLHDAWAWCPAGGTLLRNGRAPCPGPEPEACLPCYARIAQRTGPGERALVALAGCLARVVEPDRLHEAWRALPPGVRALGTALPGPRPPLASPQDLARRNASFQHTWSSMALRVAPSRYYAGLAEAARLGPTRVLPQGVDPTGPWEGAEGPLVFLGTLAPHKGAHLVVEAFRRAFPERARAGEGLLVHGPVVDPAYARSLRWPLAGPLAPDEVPPLLRRARALVLGSIWPENAPLVLSEARACGCPVVAPAIGGIPEVVEDGRDGWLYPAGEREALAGALRRVVHDAPLLPRPPPTLEAHAAAVISLYEEVLFAAGRRGG